MSNLWDKFFKGQWTRNKKWDPLTHRAIELTVHQDAHNVAAIDHGISKMTGGDGSTVLGDESRKVEHDPVRGIGRAALTAGAVFGGMYAAGSYGGSGAGAGAGVGEAGAGGMTIDAGGMGMGEIGSSQMTPALMESAVGTPGYGASSAGLGGGAGQMGLSSQQFQQMGQQTSQMGDKAQADEKPITEVDMAALAAFAAQEEENRQRMALSSKKFKTPGGNGNAMRLGSANADPIDANGVQIAAIKELTQRAAGLHKRMAAIKAKRKGH